jgi:predicted O-linked N-acetylglucosamine transferase (SPINDLY family)
MSLFSKNIAPIQVNYLGYAGTTGAKFYDYLIADEVVIPPEETINYTEKIAYLPNSFFPIDTSYPISKFNELPSRISQCLPEDSFVFACFNNSYKISPEIFEIWMRLLKEVKNSVLWLSKPSDRAIANLVKKAALKGIAEERIIFADRVPDRSDHLNRLRLVDLFLDTPIYNAHATAADALWVGVPVLTILGSTFAGRVAASQICRLGLSEMIAQSNEEYYLNALNLAENHKRLAEIKNMIKELRLTTPLFNTKQYVQDLESLYHNFYENLTSTI